MASGPCQIHAYGLPALEAEWGHVAGTIRPYPAPIIGRAFFSCVDTEYYMDRWPLETAILLDAQHPGRMPAAIPGMKPDLGAPGLFNAPGDWHGRYHRDAPRNVMARGGRGERALPANRCAATPFGKGHARMTPMLLLDPDHPGQTADDPQQGVIEDARRRQRVRRKRIAIAVLVAGSLLAGAALASSGSSPALKRASAGGTRAASSGRAGLPAFNVRLVPMLTTVGVAGWCEVPEEHGSVGGSACGGLPVPRQPFLQILGSSEARSPTEIQVAVTDPQVMEVAVDGHRRVRTSLLPGLPYGLRGARMVTSVGATVTALDAAGLPIPRFWAQPVRQATVLHWRQPQQEPEGACHLRSTGISGLTAHGGSVASTLRPFSGQLIGHAFLPCAITQYRLKGEPLKAIVVLDAAQPGTRPANLPGFHAVRDAPRIFAGGSLTAMRSGNAWLVVEQGTGPAQQVLLLHHLSATVHAPL